MGVNEVRSVMTALRVLDEVAAREPIGVGELARLLELPKSSVQRTLHAAGWIHPAGAESTRWELTTHILRTGQRATGGLGLRDVAVPDGGAAVGDAGDGAPRRSEQDRAILIERLDSPQPVWTWQSIKQRGMPTKCLVFEAVGSLATKGSHREDPSDHGHPGPMRSCLGGEMRGTTSPRG